MSPNEEQRPTKRGSAFGAGVLESTEADEQQRSGLLEKALPVIFVALVGSGFLTCGFSEMFAK